MVEPNGSPRRNSSEDAHNRHALLDAAEQLMLDEGYAAVTARRVAAKAGLKHQLVHYYFASMDEVFVSIIRRGEARTADLLEQALATPQPLRALWVLSSDGTVTTLSTELFAAARHRSEIRVPLVAAANRFRRAQAEALADLLQRADIDTGDVPADVLLLLVESLIRIVRLEDGIGMTTFHDEAMAFIEGQLARIEEAPTAGPGNESSRFGRTSAP